VDGDAKVQEKSIVLMVYLAKSEENRSPLRESGCLEVLCSKLDSPRSVILHNCMAALVNAVIGNSKNQNAIRENGSIKKIVALMMDEKSPKVTIRLKSHCFFLNFGKISIDSSACMLAVEEIGDK
jgi:hypothetical protein